MRKDILEYNDYLSVWHFAVSSRILFPWHDAHSGLATIPVIIYLTTAIEIAGHTIAKALRRNTETVANLRKYWNFILFSLGIINKLHLHLEDCRNADLQITSKSSVEFAFFILISSINYTLFWNWFIPLDKLLAK